MYLLNWGDVPNILQTREFLLLQIRHFLAVSTISLRSAQTFSIEWIKDGQKILAVIMTAEYLPDKTECITPDDYKQQLGFIVYEKGKTITLHLYRPVKRSIIGTPEALLIRRGKVRVKLYTEEKRMLATRELNEGGYYSVNGWRTLI